MKNKIHILFLISTLLGGCAVPAGKVELYKTVRVIYSGGASGTVRMLDEGYNPVVIRTYCPQPKLMHKGYDCRVFYMDAEEFKSQYKVEKDGVVVPR